MSTKEKMSSGELEKVSGGTVNDSPLCPRCGRPLSRALYSADGGRNIPVWNCERCEDEWNSLCAAPPDNVGFNLYIWPLDFFHANNDNKG